MINKRLSIYSEPSVEPVSLSEVKAILRIDSTDEDSLLTSLIETARLQCEQYTKRAFITQTWEIYQDGYDGADYIELMNLPIISIISLTTYDTANIASIFDSSKYSLIQDKLVLNEGEVFPSDLRIHFPIVTKFYCGHGAASQYVPEGIRTAIMYQIQALYEGCEPSQLNNKTKALLFPYKILKS